MPEIPYSELLNEYINKFAPNLKEEVYNQIVTYGIIKNALVNPENRIIFEEPIRKCKEYTLRIVVELLNSNESPEESVKKILGIVYQLRANLEFLKSISTILSRGKNHIDKIKELK